MSTFKLANWLSAEGHNVGVFSFQSKGHITQTFSLLFAAPNSGGQKNRCNLSALEKVLEEFGPDVVINQMPYEHHIGELLRKYDPPLLLGCLRNTLYSVRNNIDQYGAQVLPTKLSILFRNAIGRALLLQIHRKRHKRDLERILETYDRFVMFGPPNLKELSYFVPKFDKNRIELIPNSIPFVPNRIPKKDKNILWLGRVANAQKRADLILPVWKQVHATLSDWRLDIVGDGPAVDDLRDQVTRESIGGVTFHGRQVPDEYFRRASIFVMTSAYEGFPNTLVEAQGSAAVPVLFDSFPIARWIIADGRNGFLVQPFDVSAMANRIIEIAKADNIEELMSCSLENARRFQITRVGVMWQQLFERGLESCQPSADSASERIL